MSRKLISAQPPFTMLVANLAGGSDPSRGSSGNPVKVRKGFSFQHFPELAGRGPSVTPESLDTPGQATRWGHVAYETDPIPVRATATIEIADNNFAGPTVVLLGQFSLTSDEDFQVGDNVSATATLTVNATPCTATITIGGQALTPAGGARTPGGNDYNNTLGTVALIAAEIAAAVNDLANGFVAIATAGAPAGGVLPLTAVPVGSAGNAVAISSSNVTASVSGVNFEGGLDPDESTAFNLAAAIEALDGYSAVSAGNVVTVSGLFGALGNEVLLSSTGSSPSNFVFDPSAQRMAGADPHIGPPLIV